MIVNILNHGHTKKNPFFCQITPTAYVNKVLVQLESLNLD